MSSPSKDILKTFISDGSDRVVQDCISKLKFISRIRENEILNTKTLTLQEWDLTVSAYRTFVDRKQSRETSLEFYRTVIKEAFTLCISYLDDGTDPFLHHTAVTILDCLDGVSSGLSNHAKTYSGDTKHVADVETLIQTTEDKVRDIRKIIEDTKDVKQPQQSVKKK
jgi:hypothetical protein